MNVEFHESAEHEFLSDVRRYKEIDQALGDRFERLIASSLKTIMNAPDRWPDYRHGTKRLVIPKRFKFKYSIIYIVLEDAVYIIAVMHNGRHPDYWVNRLEDKPRKHH